MHKRFLSILVVFFITACASSGGTGPQYQYQNIVNLENIEPFDVAIGVFNPGLESDATTYGEGGVWPELRRAESMYMAVQLRDTLTDSGNYGAVRVTPDFSSSADIYVKAKIEDSNGEDIKLKVTVSDSTGKVWIRNKTYSHRVKEITFTNPRNKDADNKLKVDPYGPIYKQINQDIAKYVDRRINAKNADTIQTVTDIRFAQNFAPDAYSDILSERRGKYTLKGKPDSSDPMIKRIKNIQYRDQMFIDNMQASYNGFSSDMQASYRIWQQQSFAESKAAREAQSAAFWQGVAGAVVLAASVAAASSADSYDSSYYSGIAGTAVAGALFAESFQSSEEAKVHRDALNEIAESIDGNLSPSVIEMEDTTVTLTGTAKEQSDQWRRILKKIYDAENENSVDLIYIETPRTRGSDKNQNSNFTNADYKESASRDNQTKKKEKKKKKKPWPAG